MTIAEERERFAGVAVDSRGVTFTEGVETEDGPLNKGWTVAFPKMGSKGPWRIGYILTDRDDGGLRFYPDHNGLATDAGIGMNLAVMREIAAFLELRQDPAELAKAEARKYL